MLRDKLHRLVPPRCHVRRQDIERRETGGLTCGAAGKVRADHQFESGQADRLDDSPERAGEGRQGNQVKLA